MRVLFVTMVWPTQGSKNMYSDLMSEFIERGHIVDVIALSEKRKQIKTHLENYGNLRVAFAKCGNIQKVNKYKKVINSFASGFSMLYVAWRYLKKEKYDMILFALPPLTITPFLIVLKKRFKTKLYLLLKEFWPQDPVDLGAMKKGGIVWKVFRLLEKLLYKYSDYIGTMSEAGIEYLIKNNENITAELEVCPNCQKPTFIQSENKDMIRMEYDLPVDKCIFVFGGNFGVSQGIPEMIESIKYACDINDAFFLLIGNGTEYSKVKEELSSIKKDNIRVIDFMPREQFDRLLTACDVGLLFLFPRYSVPNIPSRMISYLLAQLPILAAVDKATGAGDIVQKARCGLKVINGDIHAFRDAVILLLDKSLRMEMSINSKKLMYDKYTSAKAYYTISQHFISNKEYNVTEYVSPEELL